MATEITKQPQQDGQIETWKPLYLAAWEQAFNEFMYLMAEQYSLELLIESRGVKVPSPTVKFWKENLKDLSPVQMREGLSGYMQSERRDFKPTPEDIRRNAPSATDKPRKTYNRDCKACNGTGWRLVEVDMKTTDVFYKPGKKRKAVADCFCVRVVYGGEEYIPADRQLAAAPLSVDEENRHAAEALGKLAQKLPAIKTAEKPMPAKPLEPTEEELRRRDARMKRELVEHQGGKIQ
jgi:hypothetical protein